MSEVNVINKQKFLAELAKLLTFMYEDDRQSALRAYADMFDEAADEQALIQALNSPLRQAVEVARAYNAGTPALGSPARDAQDEDDGLFLEAIAAIRAHALSLQAAPRTVETAVFAEEGAPVNDDQLSLFDESQTQTDEPAEAAAPAPVYDNAADSFAAAFLNEDVAKQLLDLPDDEPEPAEKPEEPQPETQNEPATADEDEEEEDQSLFDDEDDYDDDDDELLPARNVIRKPRVLLLIPYVIFAVPITLVLLLLLLVPALASLAAAAGCVIAAVLAVLSSIGAFPKLANLLVALGAALIVLALGVLFLMLSIWLFAGAMGGLVRGVIALGGTWCYKEVEAE